ncbi:hypothetical protein [Phenylobacterium sp.]|uniref:hypothetical protein n=1 Tax=Phenylobacterium sp. TaxID=1871053 RepID=UPI002E37389E|nr:hypothetical protein [Phenylobacterium sp.]HEX2560982.1 hypothetical protein [Phenylobacterium sp.]
MKPRLEAAYAEPHRRYHTRAHIEACLTLLDEVQGLSAHERQILAWAIWWHDAIYDAKAADKRPAAPTWPRRTWRRWASAPPIAPRSPG